MVHTGAAAREESSDRSVLACRRHELDATLSDEHRGRVDALLLERLPMLESRAEEPLVGRNGLVEVGHRDTEMMDPPHRGDATRGSQSRAGSARTVPTVSDDCDSAITSESSA